MSPRSMVFGTASLSASGGLCVCVCVCMRALGEDTSGDWRKQPCSLPHEDEDRSWHG